MTRAGERKIAKKEQVNGGAGHVLMEALLNEDRNRQRAQRAGLQIVGGRIARNR